MNHALHLDMILFRVGKVFRPHRMRDIDAAYCYSRSGIRYDTKCYFNLRSKSDSSHLNLPRRYSVCVGHDCEPRKTLEPIEMPFCRWTRVGLRCMALDSSRFPTGRGTFGDICRSIAH